MGCVILPPRVMKCLMQYKLLLDEDQEKTKLILPDALK